MNRIKKINVVCFGGGTGLPALLSGLKHNPWLNITAIVNMFDTGGSSGELRDRFGILPPGDILKCLLALSEDEANARKIFLKRVSHSSFSEHTGGNVLLFAFEKVYGNQLDAIDALGQILSIKGKVAPVVLNPSNLYARYADESIRKGETDVDKGLNEGKEIKELFLDPKVKASEKALSAIKKADVLCVGPGSFYTSVLPNFLPLGVKEEIKKTEAPIIFIVNLLTEGLGMESYDLQKTIKIAEKYIGRKISSIVVNDKLPERKILELYSKENKYPIKLGTFKDNRIIIAGLWNNANIARHDSVRLANLIFSVVAKLP